MKISNMDTLRKYIEKISLKQFNNKEMQDVVSGIIQESLPGHYSVLLSNSNNETIVKAYALNGNEKLKKDDHVFLIKVNAKSGGGLISKYYICGLVTDIEDEMWHSTEKERFKAKYASDDTNYSPTIHEEEAVAATYSLKASTKAGSPQRNFPSKPQKFLTYTDNNLMTDIATEGAFTVSGLFTCWQNSSVAAADIGNYGLIIKAYNEYNGLLLEEYLDTNYFEGQPYNFDNSLQTKVVNVSTTTEIKKIEIWLFSELKTKILNHYVSDICIMPGAVIPPVSDMTVTVYPIEGSPTYFGLEEDSEPITLEALVTYKNQELFSEELEYYWFIEDDNVSGPDNLNYLPIGGKGWSCLNGTVSTRVLAESTKGETELEEVDGPTIRDTSNKRIQIRRDQCQKYKTKVKCVAKYRTLQAEGFYEIINLQLEKFFAEIVANPPSCLILEKEDKIQLTCSLYDADGAPVQEGSTFFGSIKNIKYQWYKELEAITNATANTITIEDDGEKSEDIETVSTIEHDDEEGGTKKVVTVYEMKDADNGRVNMSCSVTFKLEYIVTNAMGTFTESADISVGSNVLSVMSKTLDAGITAVTYYKCYFSPSMNVDFQLIASEAGTIGYIPTKDTANGSHGKTYYIYNETTQTYEQEDKPDFSSGTTYYEQYTCADWEINLPEYVKTADTECILGKTYYIKNEYGGYSVVIDPKNALLSIYYEKNNNLNPPQWELIADTDEQGLYYLLHTPIKDKGNEVYLYYTSHTIWFQEYQDYYEIIKVEDWEYPMIARKIDNNGNTVQEGAVIDQINIFNQLTQNGKEQGIFYAEDAYVLTKDETYQNGKNYFIKDSAGRYSLWTSDDPTNNFDPSKLYELTEEGKRLYINASFINTGTLRVGGTDGTEKFFASIDQDEVKIGGFTVDNNELWAGSIPPEKGVGVGPFKDEDKDKDEIQNYRYFGTEGLQIGNWLRIDAENGLVIDKDAKLAETDLTLEQIFTNKQLWIVYSRSPIDDVPYPPYQTIDEAGNIQDTNIETGDGSGEESKVWHTVIHPDDNWMCQKVDYFLYDSLDPDIFVPWSEPQKIKGQQGDSVTGIVEYYKISKDKDTPPDGYNSASVKDILNAGWGITFIQPTSEYPYLWNFEISYYSPDSEAYRTAPQMIAEWTADGRGIENIINYYAVNNDSINYPHIEAEEGDETGEGIDAGINLTDWSTTPVATSAEKPFLWNFERIQYSKPKAGQNETDIYENTIPAIIGTHGIDGLTVNKVIEWYHATSSSPYKDIIDEEGNVIGQTINPPATDDPDIIWTKDRSSWILSDTLKYLWNYETGIKEIEGEDNDKQLYATEPQLIATFDGYNIKDMMNFYAVAKLEYDENDIPYHNIPAIPSDPVLYEIVKTDTGKEYYQLKDSLGTVYNDWVAEKYNDGTPKDLPELNILQDILFLYDCELVIYETKDETVQKATLTTPTLHYEVPKTECFLYNFASIESPPLDPEGLGYTDADIAKGWEPNLSKTINIDGKDTEVMASWKSVKTDYSIYAKTAKWSAAMPIVGMAGKDAPSRYQLSIDDDMIVVHTNAVGEIIDTTTQKVVKIRLYEGDEQKSLEGYTLDINFKYSVKNINTENLSVSKITESNDSYLQFTFTNAILTSDSGEISIEFYDYRDPSTTTDLELKDVDTFHFLKQKAGADGAVVTAHANTEVIKKDIDLWSEISYNPSTLSISCRKMSSKPDENGQIIQTIETVDPDSYIYYWFVNGKSGALQDFSRSSYEIEDIEKAAGLTEALETISVIVALKDDDAQGSSLEEILKENRFIDQITVGIISDGVEVYTMNSTERSIGVPCTPEGRIKYGDQTDTFETSFSIEVVKGTEKIDLSQGNIVLPNDLQGITFSVSSLSEDNTSANVTMTVTTSEGDTSGMIEDRVSGLIKYTVIVGENDTKTVASLPIEIIKQKAGIDGAYLYIKPTPNSLKRHLDGTYNYTSIVASMWMKTGSDNPVDIDDDDYRYEWFVDGSTEKEDETGNELALWNGSNNGSKPLESVTVKAYLGENWVDTEDISVVADGVDTYSITSTKTNISVPCDKSGSILGESFQTNFDVQVLKGTELVSLGDTSSFEFKVIEESANIDISPLTYDSTKTTVTVEAIVTGTLPDEPITVVLGCKNTITDNYVAKLPVEFRKDVPAADGENIYVRITPDSTFLSDDRTEYTPDKLTATVYKSIGSNPAEIDKSEYTFAWYVDNGTEAVKTSEKNTSGADTLILSGLSSKPLNKVEVKILKDNKEIHSDLALVDKDSIRYFIKPSVDIIKRIKNSDGTYSYDPSEVSGQLIRENTVKNTQTVITVQDATELSISFNNTNDYDTASKVTLSATYKEVPYSCDIGIQQDGEDGKDGTDGKDGVDGTSPYFLEIIDDFCSVPFNSTGTVMKNTNVLPNWRPTVKLYYGSQQVTLTKDMVSILSTNNQGVAKGSITDDGALQLTITNDLFKSSTSSSVGYDSAEDRVVITVTAKGASATAEAVKQKSGSNGASGTYTYLGLSDTAIKKTDSGYSPSSITAKIYTIIGSGDPVEQTTTYYYQVYADNDYKASLNGDSSIQLKSYYSASESIRIEVYSDSNYNNLIDKETISIVSDGDKGEPGDGISTIVNYYLATNQASGITTASSGWTTEIQNISATKKYLWNYEEITYTGGKEMTTTIPCVIGTHGEKGPQGDGWSIIPSVGSIIRNQAKTSYDPNSFTFNFYNNGTQDNRYYYKIYYDNSSSAVAFINKINSTQATVICTFNLSNYTSKPESSITIKAYEKSTSTTPLTSLTIPVVYNGINGGKGDSVKSVTTYYCNNNSTTTAPDYQTGTSTPSVVNNGVQTTWYTDPSKLQDLKNKPQIWSINITAISDGTSTAYETSTPVLNVFAKGIVVLTDGTMTTISGDRIVTGTIQSSGAEIDSTTGYTTKGTIFDLSNGSLVSKQFKINSSGNAYFSGEVNASKLSCTRNNQMLSLTDSGLLLRLANTTSTDGICLRMQIIEYSDYEAKRKGLVLQGYPSLLMGQSNSTVGTSSPNEMPSYIRFNNQSCTIQIKNAFGVHTSDGLSRLSIMDSGKMGFLVTELAINGYDTDASRDVIVLDDITKQQVTLSFVHGILCQNVV